MTYSASSHSDRIARLLGREMASSGEEIWASQMKRKLSPLIRRGHFKLNKNRHSNVYVHFSESFFKTEQGAETVRYVADHLRFALQRNLDEIDAVVGPEPTGSLLADNLAGKISEQTGREVVSVHVLKDEQSGYVLSGPGNNLLGKKVLPVDTVLDSGVTMGLGVLPLIRQAKAIVLPVLTIVDRNYLLLPLFTPHSAVWVFDSTECHPEDECPLCRSGIPITDP